MPTLSNSSTVDDNPNSTPNPRERDASANVRRRNKLEIQRRGYGEGCFGVGRDMFHKGFSVLCVKIGWMVRGNGVKHLWISSG